MQVTAGHAQSRARTGRQRGDARDRDGGSNLDGAAPDDPRMNTWHVAFGFALLVDARGRISGAWRYGPRGVVPVLVYVA